MITQNDWIVNLIEEHYLVLDVLTSEEFTKIKNDAEDKINFKEGLKE